MLREIVEKRQLIVFDLYVKGVKVFSSSNDNAADLVENKLKLKKYKNKPFKVFRTINGKDEDVTKLFK